MLVEKPSRQPKYIPIRDDAIFSNSEALLVRVRGKKYPSGSSVLNSIEFSVRKGEILSILGPSGGGKTTLLRLIAGLDTDFDGEIYASGKLVTGPGRDRGMVFQESRLLPWLTVQSNVEFALPATVGREEKQKRAQQVLDLVGLYQAKQLLPYQLSGGMEKRVALARALANLPTMLLLDEPFSAVDLTARYVLQDEISKIHEQEGLTTIVVTHDIDEAIYMSNRVLILKGFPAKIRDEIQIEVPRPRRRTDSILAEARQKVFESIIAV